MPGFPQRREASFTALSKSPETRFETCIAFVEALARAAVGMESAKTSTISSAPQKERSRLGLWAAGAFATALLACTSLAQKLPSLPGVLAKGLLHPKSATVTSPPRDNFSLKMGRTRVNRRDDLTYVWIAPGTYRMGCSKVDIACHEVETPHQVALTRGFWIGQTDVTAQAFRHFVLAKQGAMPVSPDDNQNWKDETAPISNVSWSAASGYCVWTGGRLHTEAEWEYAARGGSDELRYGAIEQIAWYKANSGGHAHAVKTLVPNAYGLYDMLGNVWQWTADSTRGITIALPRRPIREDLKRANIGFCAEDHGSATPRIFVCRCATR